MENFDALGQIIKDVAEVLEITDLWDFDRAFVNRVNSTFNISYQVLKLVGSSMSSRQ